MDELTGQHATADHHGKAFQLHSGIQQNYLYLENDQKYLRPLDLNTLPLSFEVDPVKLAVHRSAPQLGNNVPAYIERDVDALLDSQIGQARECGGFILVVGESTAGKSRSTYQSIVKILPEFRLFFPETKDDINRFAMADHASNRKTVLWIEDLDQYILPDCLTPGVLRDLISKQIVVVATMRSESFKIYQPGARYTRREDLRAYGSSGMADVVRMGQHLLNQAEPIIVNRRWSKTEIARARESHDPRIVDAAAHSSKYGISEYLAAGPQLLRELEIASAPTGNPRGASLVLAAIDIARTGLTGPIPIDLIKAVHNHYLDRNGGSLLRPEPFEAALEWAAELRYGVTSLLIPSRKPEFFQAFDYLVDEYSRDTRTIPVPKAVWSTVLDFAETRISALFSVSVAAIRNSRPDLATEALKRVADLSDTRVSARLGTLYAQVGNYDEAERWLRISISDNNVENLCRFGGFLGMRYRFQEAAEIYNRALALGHEDARLGLGAILEESNDIHGAKEQYQLAFSAGLHWAAGFMGKLLDSQKSRRDAEMWLKRGFNNENAWCGCLLGSMLGRMGRTDEAIAVLKKSFSMGHDHAASEIGIIYDKLGDQLPAETWYAAGSRRRSPAGMCCHGDFLLRQGSTSDAIELLQRALNAGHTHAGYVLGELYKSQGNLGQSIIWHKQAAELGNAESACRVGSLMLRSQASEYEEAQLWLRASIAGGHFHAGCVLGTSLVGSDSFEEAEAAFKAAIHGGHDHAREKLQKLYLSQGRGREAGALLRSARSSRTSSKASNRKSSKTSRAKKRK
jgi:uncharacterized protein